MLSMGATAVSTIIFASTLHLGLPATLARSSFSARSSGSSRGRGGLGRSRSDHHPQSPSILILGRRALLGWPHRRSGRRFLARRRKLRRPRSNQIVLFLVIAVVAEIIVERTRFGRELRLIGMNPSAASVAGLRVQRT